MPKKFLVIIL